MNALGTALLTLAVFGAAAALYRNRPRHKPSITIEPRFSDRIVNNAILIQQVRSSKPRPVERVTVKALPVVDRSIKPFCLACGFQHSSFDAACVASEAA